MHLKTILLLPLVTALASACALLDPKKADVACPAVAYLEPPPINVAIRDQAGAGAALGAVVTFGGGGRQLRDSTLSDTLTISGGTYETIYGVLVSKQYYTSATFDSAYVPGTVSGLCGEDRNFGPPITLNATLTLLPGSPPVRALYLRAVTGLTILDRGGRDSLNLAPWLDANADVSHAIIWRLSGDTASVSFNPATGEASFRCRSTLGIVNVVAMAAADTTITASMTLRVQEHPASSTDPPCS